MRKLFLNNPDFVKAVEALMQDKNILARAKLQAMKIHRQLVAESQMLSEVQIGLYEANCHKDANGRCLTKKEIVEGNEIEVYDLLPERKMAVNAQVQQLFNEEMVFEPIPVTDLGETHNLSTRELTILVEAGLVSLEPVKP